MFVKWVVCEDYQTMREREGEWWEGRREWCRRRGESEGGTEDEEEAGSEDRRVMDEKLRSKRGTSGLLNMCNTFLRWLTYARASSSAQTTLTCPLSEAAMSGVIPSCMDNDSEQ